MRIIVFAGPNGAGKTSFAMEYLEGEGEGAGLPYVNGDDIAARLSPENPAAVAGRAGRIALRQMEAHVDSGVDFALETTLSGRAYAVRIRRWQARGYRVAIVYLRLPEADYAVARVAQRVAEGGHDIPEAVIRRRFARSWANFIELYRDVADEWRVYDTSVDPPRLLQESAGWKGILGRHPSGRLPGRDDVELARPPAATEEPFLSVRRPGMAGQPGRFPDGAPSVKGVLAALARAQKKAEARAAAVAAARSSSETSDGGDTAATPSDPAPATSTADERADL